VNEDIHESEIVHKEVSRNIKVLVSKIGEITVVNVYKSPNEMWERPLINIGI